MDDLKPRRVRARNRKTQPRIVIDGDKHEIMTPGISAAPPTAPAAPATPTERKTDRGHYVAADAMKPRAPARPRRPTPPPMGGRKKV